MYSPESHINELIDNDDNDINIKTESDDISNELTNNESISDLNQDGVYNTVMCSQTNSTLMGTVHEDNKQSVTEDSYTFNRGPQYSDSTTELSKINLETENVSQNIESQIGDQEVYEKQDNSVNLYQPLNTYDPKIFDRINFSEFVGTLGRNPENDTLLPIANIGRLMKSVLPNSAKIAKQAKDMIRDCVTEFIFFISSEASDLCNMERRKTLNADDIFIAMNKLGFEHYDKPLKMYHTKWRKIRESNLTHNNPRN